MKRAKFDPIEYWEGRHAELKGDYRNVGDRTLTSSENHEQITARAITVAHTLGKLGVPRGARILDAGCGAGVLTDILEKGGFDMTGLDASSTAIAEARHRSNASYEVALLSQFQSETLFDVVLCLDVLFHVIDDGEWKLSLKNSFQV